MTEKEITVSVYAQTDLGRTRDHNEDAFLVADLSTGREVVITEPVSETIGHRGFLFLVADGMGGAAAGELASSMAADLIFAHLTQALADEEEVTQERFIFRLQEAVELANLQIHSYAKEHQEVRGMGTTATVAGVLQGRLYLAQVGDSRGYLVREGTAVQLTKDQSLTQRLVDAGELTEEEAERSERRNIILQALGPDAHIRVELTYQDLKPGDTLVLCSDGLSGLVKRDEIAAAVSNPSESIQQTTQDLIDRANQRGGPDNVTVVLARFGGSSPTAIPTDAPPEADEVAYKVLDPDLDHRDKLQGHEEEEFVLPTRRSGSPMMVAGLIGLVLVALVVIFLLITL